MSKFIWLILIILNPSSNSFASILGEENILLIELVHGQLNEIQALADQLEATRDQAQVLSEMNRGIQSTTRQIRSIESIVSRAKGLEPGSVKRLSQINLRLRELKELHQETRDLVEYQSEVVNQILEKNTLQSETTYSTGGELVKLGSELSVEAETASPGRAAQITASAESAQLVAKGVELQTLSNIAELQATQLELTRSQIEMQNKARNTEDEVFKNSIKAQIKRDQSTKRLGSL